MTSDERGWCICQLVPGAKYRGCWTDNTAVWEDERPIPSESAINQYYIEWKSEDYRIACLTAAHKEYAAVIEAGYEHTDGHTYYCNEKGVMDMCMAMMLNDNDPEEPVLVLDIAGNLVEKTIVEFKALATAVGRYHYAKRQEYWASLAACEV